MLYNERSTSLTPTSRFTQMVHVPTRGDVPARLPSHGPQIPDYGPSTDGTDRRRTTEPVAAGPGSATLWPRRARSRRRRVHGGQVAAIDAIDARDARTAVSQTAPQTSSPRPGSCSTPTVPVSGPGGANASRARAVRVGRTSGEALIPAEDVAAHPELGRRPGTLAGQDRCHAGWDGDNSTAGCR